jgi:hypothetical protein
MRKASAAALLWGWAKREIQKKRQKPLQVNFFIDSPIKIGDYEKRDFQKQLIKD